MKKEFVLNKKEKEIITSRFKFSIGELLELLQNDIDNFPIKQFVGQRPYKNRPSDRDGFLASIIRVAEQIIKDRTFSETMKKSLMKVGKNVSETEVAALTNTQFFMTNLLEIFDGQHRFNWTIGFLNGQYKVPEQVCDENLVGKTFEQIQEFYPELAKAISEITFDFVMLDTNDINTVAKYFYQMNSGAKKVSPTEGMLALKAGTSSIDFYKSLAYVDDEITFRGRNIVMSFYSRTPMDAFVRNICYLTDIAVKGSPEGTIGKFIDVTNGLTADEFWKDMRNFAKLYKEIDECNLLKEACIKYKGHCISSLTKILYIIAKNVSKKAIEGYDSLDTETIKIAGKILRSNQVDINRAINEKVNELGFKIGSSVKDISMTDELVKFIVDKTPSLGINF